MKEDIIVIKNKDGIDEQFYKISQFTSVLTNKDYIIYTDKKYTNNKLNVYCSIISFIDGELTYSPLETEEDKQEFKKAFSLLIEK